MRLWTIQPREVWEKLENHGEVWVEEACLTDGYVPDQYRWLAQRLARHLPDYSGRLPWWAYGEFADLRSYRFTRPRGKPQVRIELELSADRAYRMPCWAWNMVYGAQYLTLDAAEHECWMGEVQKAFPGDDYWLWQLPDPWKSQLEASWELLFHPDLPSEACVPDHAFAGRTTEIVFEVIRHVDVVRVTHFTGASRMWR